MNLRNCKSIKELWFKIIISVVKQKRNTGNK
jgi:hypothetical protein